MSGMPGLAFPVAEGGIGFDYRLAMGGPDFWIKLIKEQSDEHWNMDQLFQELASRRWDEKTINYCESHDQALVGDKTIIFRLIDADMYWHFAKHNRNLNVDRGIALHKMIRLITLATSGGGYLNFMGNEFGHPEWIDFPRDGNGHSYHYARRQWSLRDHWDLCYEYLANFDQEMIGLVKDYHLLDDLYAKKHFSHCSDLVLVIERNNLLFAFNFHPVNSYQNYTIYAPLDGQYREILHSDEWHFGGHGRLVYRMLHQVVDHSLRLYLPARSVVVLAPTSASA